MIEPVVYQCSVKPNEHRILLCEPVGGGSVTLFCTCNAPMTCGPVDGFTARRLVMQSHIDGQHSVLACLSDEHHGETKSYFRDGK